MTDLAEELAKQLISAIENHEAAALDEPVDEIDPKGTREAVVAGVLLNAGLANVSAKEIYRSMPKFTLAKPVSEKETAQFADFLRKYLN